MAGPPTAGEFVKKIVNERTGGKPIELNWPRIKALAFIGAFLALVGVVLGFGAFALAVVSMVVKAYFWK